MPAFETEIQEIYSKNRYRELVTSDRTNFPYIKIAGIEYLSFADNDYFGLSCNDEVRAVAINSMNALGAGASRFVTGNHAEYEDLERLLANYKLKDEALIFGSGYLAAIGLFQSIADKNTVIFMDKAMHACSIDGVKLSGATLHRYKHQDMAHLKSLLDKYRKSGKSAIIVTESIFSMDGDITDLNILLKMAEAYDCKLLIDDAHGLGFVDIPPSNDIIILGTLSKALGGYGGYVAASSSIIEIITQKARSLLFSTALPPSIIAGARKAMELLISNPDYLKQVKSHSHYIQNELRLATTDSPIIPIILGDEVKTLAAHEALKSHGIFVPAIRPPTIAAGTCRLRISVTSAHKHAHIIQLVAALKGLL